MFNVILSVVVSLMNGLPEAGAPESMPVVASVSAQNTGLDTLFRDDVSPVVTPLPRPRWISASSDRSTVIRGQSGGGGTFEAPPMSAPLAPQYQPLDPFQIQSGPDPVIPYLNNIDPMILSGINGPQPYRFGFTPIMDAAFIAPSHVSGPGNGQFGVQEYDLNLRHVSLVGQDWVFSNTAQAGTRVWTGPNTPNLPPEVYRFGWDFLLNTPNFAGWNLQLDFNPSLNTDLGGSISRHAVNLDGSVTALYRTSPQVMWVLGAQYWERVENIIIPNAGVVWNPDDRFELRLLFPKSRVSYFLGNFGPASHWLYATAEYHVESYQFHSPGISGSNQIQLSDYRAAIGLRSDHGWYDKFIEVGYVFNRHAKYLQTVPDYNINGGLMARIGVRF